MKKFLVANSWWLVSIITIALLILHTLSIANFTIDNVSLVLLTLLLISPFISQVRKIKMGDFEAEIDPKEIQKVKDDVDNKLSDTAQEIIPEAQETVYNIKNLLDSDHILALAKLRIELEKTINKLYRLYFGENIYKNDKPIALGKLVHELTLREVLPQDISSPLREILYFCNRAVHGDEVKLNDARKIIDSGVSIYNYLIDLGQEYVTKPTETIEINKVELEKYFNAMYKVVTVIPYVENPVKNTRILNQQGLDELLGGYDEYAEFIIEISLVDQDNLRVSHEE